MANTLRAVATQYYNALSQRAELDAEIAGYRDELIRLGAGPGDSIYIGDGVAINISSETRAFRYVPDYRRAAGWWLALPFTANELPMKRQKCGPRWTVARNVRAA